MTCKIFEINLSHPLWEPLLKAAPSIGESILQQLTLEIEWALSNHILVAAMHNQPVGVLRFITQRLGEDEERPPIIFKGETLIEAKVISFGVMPEHRNLGIGRRLQEHAIALARELKCYQFRSRSRYHSKANFHLKISLGSGIQPSLQDNSVYFIIVL
jgi:GNAT superfamily N-acetyltransferase